MRKRGGAGVHVHLSARLTGQGVLHAQDSPAPVTRLAASIAKHTAAEDQQHSARSRAQEV
jgi:hypothetical protein